MKRRRKFRNIVKHTSTLSWIPSEMILPISKALQGYFYSNAYRSLVSLSKQDFEFVLAQQPSAVGAG